MRLLWEEAAALWLWVILLRLSDDEVEEEVVVEEEEEEGLTGASAVQRGGKRRFARVQTYVRGGGLAGLSSWSMFCSQGGGRGLGEWTGDAVAAEEAGRRSSACA